MIDRRHDPARKSYRTFVMCLLFTIAVWLICTADIVYLRIQRRHQLAAASRRLIQTTQSYKAALERARQDEMELARLRRKVK